MSAQRSMRIEGWGRQAVWGEERSAEDLMTVVGAAALSRGLGRSYGDASLPHPSRPLVVGTTLADRILDLDPASGCVRAEAGLSLAELIRQVLPLGLWPPASPGTQFVTLGGMVAADVHGKSHHRDGTFSQHVRRLRMVLADGSVVDCSPSENAELFAATCGGMGLTGHILEVELTLQRVPSPWIWQETERIDDIDRFLAELRTAASQWPYTAGWIDCLARGRRLGRGILFKGRWAEPGEAPNRFPRPASALSVPFVLPSWLLSPATVRGFNEAVYRTHPRRPRRGIVSPEAFFYPLDRVRHWNRIYGPRGLTQHQCVLPEAERPGAARRFLDVLTRLGGASFLCVIKDCGAESGGLLSFPRPGISIAADFKVDAGVQARIDRLNETVLAESGRIYLAKDGFSRREHFAAMESARLPRFTAARRRYDPEGRLRSALSVRLLGDMP